MTHPVGYTGPPEGYLPVIGNSDPSANIDSFSTNPIATYANLDYFNTHLRNLVQTSTQFVSDLENTLQGFSVPITADPADAKLAQAHIISWPTDLGTPQPYITYRYYKSLENVNSSAASYIRNAYESAARGPSGTNAIDILPIANITLEEAQLVQEFTSQYATSLNDSSQRRTVELLQDWVESATQQIANAQTVFQGRGTAQTLPSSEMGTLSSQDASNSQALFQVNLNQLNTALVKGIGTFQQLYNNFASSFYNNVFGPALGHRTTVTTGIDPVILPNTVSTTLRGAVTYSNQNLTNALADQLRRNNMYANQVDNILTTVQLRDSYRSYITQLSTIGIPVPSGAAGTMIQATDTPDQAAFFDSLATSQATPNNPFEAPHSELSGILDPSAHPQYYQVAGGELGGNMTLAPGVTVDGIIPSQHAHTAQDGSQQINAANLLPGTLLYSAVDQNDRPAVPQNVTVVSATMNANGGIDFVFEWEGDDALQHEVQLSAISLATPNFSSSTPNF